MASETLRMELAPFGVNVITAMIGLVSTNFHPNSLDFQLPKDSMYKSIEQHIADENSGKHNPPGMDVNVLAKNLVDDILKKKTGQIWRGKSASAVKWASTFVPSRTFDGMVANGRGIDELVKNTKEGKT
jgi:1-acylglycerone phosphate reductase